LKLENQTKSNERRQRRKKEDARDVFEKALDDGSLTFNGDQELLDFSAILGGLIGAGVAGTVGRAATRGLGMRRSGFLIEVPLLAGGAYAGGKTAHDAAKAHIAQRKKHKDDAGDDAFDQLKKLQERQSRTRKR
jgi:hypothetical protein